MKWRNHLLILLVISPLLLLNCRDEVRSQPYFEKLLTLSAAGTPPHVGYVDTLRLPEYIENDLLWPVPDELVDDDFDPELLAYFQRDDNELLCSGSSGTCKTYALPRDFQTVALVMNTDLFEESGIVPPDELQNFDWDAFREIAAMLTDAGEDVKGVGFTTSFANWLPFLFQANGSWFDEAGMSVTLDTDQAREALTFYTDLVRDEYAIVVDGPGPYPGVYDEGGLLDMFVNEQVGMALIGPSMYHVLRIKYEQQGISEPPLKVVELPAGPTGAKATIAYVVGFGLFREPSAPALELLEFVTSEEGMMIWFSPESLGLGSPVPVPPTYIPARMSLRDAWMEAHPGTEAFVEGAQHLAFYQPAVVPFGAMEEFDRQATEILREVLLREMPVEEAVQELQAKGDEIMSGYGQ